MSEFKFMSIKINYKSSISKSKSKNIVFFVDEKFRIQGIKTLISKTEYSYTEDLLKTKDFKNKIIISEIDSKKKLILVSVKKNIKNFEAENLGAKFYNNLKNLKINDFEINTDYFPTNLKNFVGYFLHGLKLKSYVFDKYKTKKNKNEFTFFVNGKNIPSKIEQIKFNSIEKGTFYARDLVSEPGNVLHPDEYAKRINSLRKLGLKITVYDDKKIETIRNEYPSWRRSGKHKRIIPSNHGMEWFKR